MIFRQEWPRFSSACASWGLYKFFIGLVGEYILSINSRVMKRPLVIEEERLNFEENHHPESNPQDRGKTPCNADVEAGQEQQVQG